MPLFFTQNNGILFWRFDCFAVYLSQKQIKSAMSDIGTILNVKLPFIEALEHLSDERTYVGMVSIDLAKIIYVDGGNLIPKTERQSSFIKISDIRETEWYLVLRK